MQKREIAARHKPARRKHIDELPEKRLGGVLGMWFNKRQLTSLEIPFRHRIVPEHSGWRLLALEGGQLVGRTEDGRIKVDIEEGDELVSSGDDFYLSLAREQSEPEPEPGEEPRDEPRDDERKEA